MMMWLYRFWLWIWNAAVALVWSRTVATPPPASSEGRRRTRRATDDEEDATWGFAKEDVEQQGTFYFRGTILDQLETYFKLLRRFKRADRDAYDLYSQIGATISTGKMLNVIWELPAFWHDREKRPAFGCMFFGPDSTPDLCCPQFFYFNKVRHNPSLQQFDGDIYEVVLYFDDLENNPRWMRECGATVGMHFGVDAASKITLLKSKQIRHTTVDYRGTANYGGKTRKVRSSESIPHTTWDYPERLYDLWKGHKSRSSSIFRPETSMEEWFCSLFLPIAAQHVAAAETGVRVQVRAQNNDAAIFCIEPKRTAYFFRDRKAVVSERGTKKRIFHVVKPHRRELAGGRVRYVKMHFRGLRQFEWNSYRVTITVPGLHHLPMMEFTPASFTLPEDAAAPNSVIDQRELGGMLSKMVHGFSLRELVRRRHSEPH
jgi:hypothetical protein